MDIAVVGAGLAGLAAAVELTEGGHTVRVLEASDGAGGRVRSDVVDGHICDRGFQILLTAYPHAKALLDYDALDLKRFQPGADVILGPGKITTVADPFRDPSSALDTLRSPVGSLTDKARVLGYRLSTTRPSLEDLWNREDVTARTRFIEFGFGRAFIDRFLGPLFAGITLDGDLGGSSRVVDFVFRMLSEGDAAVPAAGMGAIPAQLAERLPAGSLRLNTKVVHVESDSVTLHGGETITADAVIVATGTTEAARLVDTPDPGWRGVTSVWFSAPGPVAALDKPVIVLNGTGQRPLNSVVDMSAVAPTYAPSGQGRRTIVASAPSVAQGTEDGLRDQLARLLGPAVNEWRVLRTDRIPQAQPIQLPGFEHDAAVRLQSGVFVCGDHRRDASINGALGSGRAAADAVLNG